MKLLKSLLLGSALSASVPTFPQWFLDKYDEKLSFFEFEELYPALKAEMNWNGMANWVKEDYRSRNGLARPANDWDVSGICPDSVTGDSWDYDENQAGFIEITDRTIILDQSVDLAGDGLILGTGSKLIFKDLGAGSAPITLRAKSIEINGGELWIGSRSCRYQGNADIVLYGNEGDMPEHGLVGQKYIWLTANGVMEMHGKEKVSWTQLDEHIFRQNVPAERLLWTQTNWVNEQYGINNRLVFHFLSAEGDLKDTAEIKSGGSFADVQDWNPEKAYVDGMTDEEIVVFSQDNFFELTQEAKTFFTQYGADGSTFDAAFSDDIYTKYSQIGGVFNKRGDFNMATAAPDEDGTMHRGLKATVGPIRLGGMKEGFQFQVDIWNNFNFPAQENTTTKVQEWLDAMAANGGDPTTAFPDQFRNSNRMKIDYSGPNIDEAPILTLATDVSSWEVGDQIVVGATNYDSRETEVFTLVQCDECNTNQVKVDRTPTNTHWGRKETIAGKEIDQRADVGLLSRNVRFYGEMNSETCQYARTREQANPDSPNHNRNWCSYYADINGADQDFHGAHFIATSGFANMHLSHMEIFNAGQPQVGRYPVHWHHAGYVGTRGGYADPSSVEALSIHDAFSRWVTIHGTHEATIKNCAAYNTFGHGYFLEDGFESYNYVLGNFGALVKPGIILPSERSYGVCGTTSDGWNYQDYSPGDHCEGLSVFWMASLHNTIHDNSAVGANAGYWLFTHTASDKYQYDAIPRDPVTGKREWRNNKACCTSRGFAVDESIKDEAPTEAMQEAQWSIGNEFGHRFRPLEEDHYTLAQYNDDPRPELWKTPGGNWARIEFNGLNIHHTNEKNWARGADFHVDGAVFSDNSRGWIHKGTAQTPGSTKSVTNSVFVGFTRNVGHKFCWNDLHETGYDSQSLTKIKGCADSREGTPDLVGERPMTDILERRLVFWYKPYGDVYRQQGQDQYYPTQAMSIYDSYIPNLIENCTFINYPAPPGEPARRHAIGTHFNHKFLLIPKATALNNPTFVNVDTIWQTAHINSTVPDGDQYTSWKMYGATHGTTAQNSLRAHTDGELTTGITDANGIWTNGVPAYVFPVMLKNVNTDCVILGEDTPGVNFPGQKVCPITTQYASLHLQTFDWATADAQNTGCIVTAGDCEGLHFVDPELGRYLHITTRGDNLDEGTPMRYMSASLKMDQDVFANVEAFKTHLLEWQGSPNTPTMTVQVHEAEVDTWYRFSLCLGDTSTLTNIYSRRNNYGNDIVSQGWTDQPHLVANSLEELNQANMDGWYIDAATGWLHMKLYITEDRTQGGTLVDRRPDLGGEENWPTYETAGCDGWQWPGNDMKLGCKWRFNMPHGKHQIFLEVNPPASGAPVCGEIPYPEPGWPTTSRPQFGAPSAERGPKECAGKKLPAIKNGYFVCHRNLNASGNKKGKKKKCRFHCDKGWIVSTNKAKGKGKDGVIKCHSQKGWLTKPKKLMCVKKN